MIADTSGQDMQITQSKSKAKLGLWAGVIAAGAIAVMAVSPVIARWSEGVHSIDADRVSVAKVFRGDLIRDVAVSGRLVAANAPQLYSTESGVVTLQVKPGDQVSQGQILASVASPELLAELNQAQTQLESLELASKRGELEDKETALDLTQTLDNARVSLIAAKREKQRADQSYEQKVISELEWVKANDVLLEAELVFNHAKEKVGIAKERLAFEDKNRQNQVHQQALVVAELERRVALLSVKAPIDGVVGNWLVEQKEQVTASTALMTVVDLSQYEAELDVPEFYADDLGLGLQAIIQIGGNKIPAEIVSVSPEIKANQVSVRARLPQADNKGLRQNQRVNARIEFERKDDVLMVKRGAFYQSGAGLQAYLLAQDDIARKQAITTGAASVEYIEILSGLQANDNIVISDYSPFIEHEAIRLAN